jgi:hypothetical protein
MLQNNMKKYLRTAAAVVGILVVVIFYRGQGSKKANAQTVDIHVPQFGVNIGDYSNCLNGYAPDNSLGDSTSGYWTPVNGGIENGIGASGYDNQGIGAGDCIQAGIVSPWNATYDWDFKVGIRVAPYLAATGEVGHASDGSTAGDECDWSASNGWQYTGWASAGGGTSPLSVVDPFDTWGVECVQLEVVTSTLPTGVTSIQYPSFAITISHYGDPNGNDGATATSAPYDSCYLNLIGAGSVMGQYPEPPPCPLVNIHHGGNFWSASVSLGVDSMGAKESANNIPTSMTVSQQVTAGTDGGPLSITMKNTGSWPWGLYFSSSTQDTGTPTGTCAPGTDEPPSGSPAGATCSVLATITSDDYFLAHVPSSFSIASETIPVTYTNVTKTTTYTPQQNKTVTMPCGDPPPGYTPPSSFLHLMNTAFAEGPTGGGGYGGSGGPQLCNYNVVVPEYWTVSYSGGGYQDAIPPGGTVTYPISSITAPAATGTYDEQWQMQTDPTGDPFGAPFILPITVGAGGSTPTSTGTITVTSENSVNGSPVVSSWDVLDGSTDLCGNQSCVSQQQTFPNIPLGITATIEATPGSAGAGFSLREVEEQPAIAERKNFELGDIFALSKNLLFGVANAQEYCGYTTSSSQCAIPNPPSLGTNSLTPTASASTDNFVVLWDPIANMAVNSSTNPSISLSASAGTSATGQVQVSNDGKTGSTLTWSENAGASWLSAAPSSDNSGLTNTAPGIDATEVATITANTSGLSVGQYTAEIDFAGGSKPGYAPAGSIGATLTVHLTVTKAPAIGYDCEANNQCVSTTTNPQYGTISDCDKACGIQPPVGYLCMDNACSAVASGGVSSSSCAASCGEPQYSCVNNACALVSSGGTTLPQCQTSCGGGGYSCVNNACVSVSTGGTSLPDCEAACNLKKNEYACVNNACTLVPSGGTSFPDCEATCGVQPGYTCVSNACVWDPSGGTSLPNCQAACAGGGSEYSCVNNSCVLVSTGGTSLPDCNATCGGGGGGGGGLTLTASCTPSTITLSPLETSQCVLDLGGVAQSATWTVVSGSAGSIGATSGVYTPSVAGTEIVSGALSDGDSATTTITVTPPPACGGGVNCQPVCNPQLTANPSTIVVPESTGLSYSCSHVTECQLSGGDVNVVNYSSPVGTAGTINGNATDSPVITTTYTLSCVNGNYSDASVQYTVQVVVNGSTLCEQNPNAAGCPVQ